MSLVLTVLAAIPQLALTDAPHQNAIEDAAAPPHHSARAPEGASGTFLTGVEVEADAANSRSQGKSAAGSRATGSAGGISSAVAGTAGPSTRASSGSAVEAAERDHAPILPSLVSQRPQVEVTSGVVQC